MREEIAARLRGIEPRIAWDFRGSTCATEPSVLDNVSAEVERILCERTAALCAEVARLNGLISEKGI